MATSAPSPPGQLAEDGDGVLSRVLDRDVGAELLGGIEPAVGEIDRDDVGRAEEPGAHRRRQADGSGADDGDHVARFHPAVQDADLVAGGEDVGQHEDLLVGQAVRDEVGGGVGEGDADELGLGAVDLVTEDPAAPAEALAVGPLAAVTAGAARGAASTRTMASVSSTICGSGTSSQVL
jgi:hypothetical protein